MAISVVAGLASVGGYVATALATGGALAFTTAMTYFAVGAGLSMVSRALMPKPDMGTRLGGIEQTVKKPAMARQLIYGRAKVGGNIVYFDNTGANNRYLHMVIAIAGHEIDAYEKVYFNDEVVWDGTYQDDWADYARIKFYKGDQTTADSDLVSESSGWNSNCKLLDTAYLYVRLDYDQEKFADGVPNISCLVRGKKVLDPRTSTTAWSDNPALCIYDYLRDEKYGLNTSDILVSTVIASANDCETQVDYNDNGTTSQHDKYKLNGVIDTSQKISTNIENMLTAMAGRVVFSGGNFEVHSGKYVTPTVTLDESMVVGDIQFSTKTSRRSTYNGVKGMFLSEELNYTLADYPAQISSTYQAEDGEPLYLDMTLPFTVDNIRAQRLAKLALLKSRQQRTLIMPVSLAGLKLKAGDTVYINNTRLGLSNAPYEVLDYELSYGENLTVNLSLIETASEYYDWNVSDQIDFSVSTDVALYNGTPVSPSNLSLTAGTNLKADGTATGYIDASWTASDDAFVDHYIVEYSNGTDKQSIKSNDTAHRITTFNDNQTYTVNVYAVNLINRKSSALSGTVTSVIDTTAPSDITGISISGGLQTIDLSWTNPSDDDFDLVRIKVANTNSEPVNHSFEVRADNFTHDVGAYSTTKHYWLAPVDRTGNVGNYVSAGSATTGSIAIGDIPHVAGTFYLTLGDNNAPTDVEFTGAVGRNPIEGDVAVVNKAYFFTRGASAWTAVTEFIDGSLLVSDSITTTQINTDSVLAESILANTANITGDLTVTSGKITVQDTDTVINLDPDAQYPFRISQGTEDVVRLGSSTLDPFIKGAFIRGMPVQSINEADLTTFVRNVVGVTSEEKTETETLTHLPTGGNLVYLEANNITTGLTTVLTLESVAGTQSWVYEYADESDWDSGDSAFFNYTLQGYNGTAWEDISGWVNRPVFASGYRISGALVGWSISETYSRTIENNTYTHFRMVVGNMSGEFGGGLHPTSTGINCDFKLTSVTGSQVNSDNYADSFSINDTSGILTIGRTGSLGDLTADISTYVGNQVSALVDSAPETLDTLNELASALGDDPNFATTVSNSIGTKWTQDNTKISNWDTAYGWGNHAGLYFSETSSTTVSDYDSISEGFYGSVQTSAGPYANHHTLISIDNPASAGRRNQLFFPDSDENFYFRNRQGDTTGWHPWRRIWSDLDFSSTNVSNWNTAYGWGNHASAGYLSSSHDMTLTLSGDVSGSATFTNMGNATLSVTVANDSHTHDTRYQRFTYQTVDLTGLDESTYYPVGVGLPSSQPVRLGIRVGLNSGSTPSWSTHSGGFTLILEWSSNGSGWGTAPVVREVYRYQQAWASQTVCGGILQATNSSTEIVYLRGGGKYHMYADHPVGFGVYSSGFSSNGQTYGTRTTVYNNVWSATTAHKVSNLSSLNIQNTEVVDSARNANFNTLKGKGIWDTASAITHWGSADTSTAYGTLTWDTGYASIYGTSGNELRLGSHATQGRLTITDNVNSTSVGGASFSNGSRLGFNESGVRSWTMGANSGYYNLYSGDGNGFLNLADNIGLKLNGTTVIDSSRNGILAKLDVGGTGFNASQGVAQFRGDVTLNRGSFVRWATDSGGTGEYIYSKSASPYDVTIHSGSYDALQCPNTGQVRINYQGSQKFLTDSSGVDITGRVNTSTGYQVSGTTVIDSSRNITNVGTISLAGTSNRPIFIGQAGSITTKGSSGGWSQGLLYYGSSGTYRGGFGALGTADGLDYFWIGSEYNDGSNFRFYPNGTFNIGGTTVIDSSRNLSNIGTITTSGTITVGSGTTSSYIRMEDSDNGGRYIHCNSNRVGFLTSSNGWGSWCNDDGSWESGSYISGSELRVSGSTAISSSRDNLYLNSSNAGGGRGIFFRDGFGVGNYNCSITAEDNNGSFPDGLHISGYDGVTIGTGSNTRVTKLKVDQAGDTTLYGNLKINGTTVIDSSRNATCARFISSSNLVGFSGSGLSGDGYPYARIVEAWGVSISPTDPRWAPNVQTASFLVGITSSGANFGVGNIIATGNITAYYSDERLKTRISQIDNALDKVCSLDGFIYVENELAKSVGYKCDKPQLGLSAQQVKKVAPEIVSLAPFDMTGDGDPKGDGKIYSKSGQDYLTVDYARLVPMLVEAIKELKQEIEELKNVNSN